jgi:hypothetical protein
VEYARTRESATTAAAAAQANADWAGAGAALTAGGGDAKYAAAFEGAVMSTVRAFSTFVLQMVAFKNKLRCY